MAFDEHNSLSLVEENRNYWKGEPKVFAPSNAKLDKSKPKVVDLFCGMGGLSLGFESAGFEVVLGLDIHRPSIETFTHSHPNSIAVLGDMTKIMPLDAPESEHGALNDIIESIYGKTKIDVLTAGIPCQGFSLNNKKRSDVDRRNYMFLYFIEAVRLFKPKYILIENVPGLRNMNNGSFESEIKEVLKTNGYYVASKILNAADFGVPQFRRRLVFIGARDGFPVAWPIGAYGKDKAPWMTVGKALSDLPRLAADKSSKRYKKAKLTEYQKEMRGECTVTP